MVAFARIRAVDDCITVGGRKGRTDEDAEQKRNKHKREQTFFHSNHPRQGGRQMTAPTERTILLLAAKPQINYKEIHT